jgi:metallo-beta-lactamase family protein
MPATIGFYGAAQTVTGSRHLFTLGGKTILVDCGMFQGPESIRDRNWEPFPVEPPSLDAVVVSHAHLDHIGALPRLVKQGYRGPIYCTRATLGLARISLPDSGRIQEEDARRANKHGSRHQPALPLYDEQDAYRCLKQFIAVPYGVPFDLPAGVKAVYSPAGHILGSAFAELTLRNGDRWLMSGDLGRFDTPIIKDPTWIASAEYLVIESTYGNRLHPTEDVKERLHAILSRALQEGTAIIVPSFSIGRTQELLYYLRELEREGRLPRLPIFLDSPMAISATRLYAQACEEHDDDLKQDYKRGDDALEPSTVQFVRDREQSKALNSQRGPLMIISGSGMANGGRVRHHLVHRLDDPNTLLLFTGYQAEGTLGRRLLEGAPEVRIFGQEIRVAAAVDKLNALSAHADQGEILAWLLGFSTAPRRTFIVHGEPPAQEALAERIRADLGWDVVIPRHRQVFEIPD